jgi:hypothetical protein
MVRFCFETGVKNIDAKIIVFRDLYQQSIETLECGSTNTRKPAHALGRAAEV